jgi:hypothetical protein
VVARQGQRSEGGESWQAKGHKGKRGGVKGGGSVSAEARDHRTSISISISISNSISIGIGIGISIGISFGAEVELTGRKVKGGDRSGV